MERTFSTYLLFVDSTVPAAYQSLEEAKLASVPNIENKCAVRIENPAAPAPTRTWRYDYEINDWVTN